MSQASKFNLVRASSPEQFAEMNRRFSDWIKEEDPDWTVGVQDIPLYSIIDPNGMFMGVLDGQVVVIICAVNYTNTYSFIGAFWANPKYRGRGYGVQLLNAGLKHCGFRTIGMYAAPGMVSRYEREGFRQGGKMGFCEIKSDNILGNRQSISANIVDYMAEHMEFDIVAKYYRKYFPVERKDFLKAWITQAGSITLVYLEQRQIRGLGVLRRGYETGHYRLGPLYADSKDIAVEIVRNFILRIPHPSAIYFEVLKDNPDVEQFVAEINAKYQPEEATVMYRGELQLDFDVNGVFAVTAGDIG